MARPKAIMAWSSGKDSAYAIHVARSAGDLEIVGVLTTLTADYERVSMHGVRESLLDQQCAQLGLPCTKIRIPSSCTNEQYEREMSLAMTEIRRGGVDTVIFGDLFLHDLRTYRESKLAEVGMRAVFPLWRRNTRELAEEMMEAGLTATLTCVDSRQLDGAFAGRSFDRDLLAELPAQVDPCGENGEFHTVVTAGPMFEQPIAVRVGEVVDREGFVFADVLPAASPAS